MLVESFIVQALEKLPLVVFAVVWWKCWT